MCLDKRYWSAWNPDENNIDADWTTWVPMIPDISAVFKWNDWMLGTLPKWPRVPSTILLRQGFAVTRLLGLRVRIPPGVWMSVSCECCVLSGEVLCDGPITRPEESYRLCCVTECDLETSKMRRPWPALGCWTKKPCYQPAFTPQPLHTINSTSKTM